MRDNSTFRVYITGTPGTGKTSIAKCIAKKLNIEYFEINDLIVREGLYLGYDVNRDTLIVDDEKLSERLISKLKSIDKVCMAGGVILKNLPIDCIIILHSLIPLLRDRLKKRDYSHEKIESNIEAEILNIIYYDLLEFYASDIIFEFHNNDETIEETCQQIVLKMRKHHLCISE